MKKVLLIAFIIIIFGLGVFVYNKRKNVDIVVNEDEKPKSEWAFDGAVPGVTTDIGEDKIFQKGEVNGTQYTLTIDLSKWEKNTSKEQIVVLSQLFWQCYPRMYERFGQVCSSPTDIELAIENEGYEIADCLGNHIHLHDKWLADNQTDYDCITHELAHAIQNGWNEEYLEYPEYVERFADYCRFIYAYDSGYYNDYVWTLQTAETEATIKDSVRFLVWLDLNYSSEDNDLLLKYTDICKNSDYLPEEWGNAWTEIFAGSDLEGMSIDDVWAIYESSTMAYMSSQGGHGENSELREMSLDIE